VPLGLPNIGNTCYAASAFTAFWCNRHAEELSLFLGGQKIGKEIKLLSRYVKRSKPPYTKYCGNLVRLVWGTIGEQRDVAEHHDRMMEALWEEAKGKSGTLTSMISGFAQVHIQRVSVCTSCRRKLIEKESHWVIQNATPSQS